MTKSNLSKSVRQYIRKEKARIRREIPNDTEEQKRIINELYIRFAKSGDGAKKG